MNSGYQVRVAPTPPPGVDPEPSFAKEHLAGQTSAELRRAIVRTRQWLLSDQDPAGYWVGELEGDTILESEFILLQAYLGRLDSKLVRKAAAQILTQQLPEGGWATFPGGELDVSVSVKAYFALKLTGYDPSSSPMQKARFAIRDQGGADVVNSFTRFYLALLGQIDYEQCPAVPPELVLAPRWSPIHLYSVSAWSRTILVPLSIMSALRPMTRVAPELGIRELFLREPSNWPQLRCPGLDTTLSSRFVAMFFRGIDRGLKFAQRHRLLPLRRRALAAAEAWMLKRFESSDGLGAIFPPMVWSIIALRCLGYDDDSPEVRYCHEHLGGLVVEEGDTAKLQPCKSPVWDTAITLRTLNESGVEPDHEAVQRAVDWLLNREVTKRGDWAETVNAEPGGWCFEHANAFYPDMDDTAMALLALSDLFDESPAKSAHLPPKLALVGTAEGGENPSGGDSRVDVLERATAAIARGQRWMLAMQNRDGGWGAFDRDNDRWYLCYVPFADHNAMIDPSSPDLTGRVLESLGRLGRKVGDPAVDRAVAYLRSTQEADGSWFGRWGVNYVYGTWLVLTGLRAVGVEADDPAVVAGANWLLASQQSSGGWGESPASYADPALKGQGPVTASQTAWAILGLLAAGRQQHPAVNRGVQHLLVTQRPDGQWHETQFTGTGFPRVFYLRYHLYPVCFPLMALSAWAIATGGGLVQSERHKLQLVGTADVTR